MKKVMLTSIILSAVILSCSKEEEIEMPAPIVKNNPQTVENMPLAVGNYWIYETVNIDTLGNETTLNGLDSAYIDRDTIINGNTYYIVSGGTAINHILGSTIRNKGNDIVRVNSQGTDKILFSSTNPGTIYRSETIYAGPLQFFSTTKTNSSSISKNVSSGVFNCFEGVTNLAQTVPANSNWSKLEKRYYEKSVGVVAGQYTYYANTNILELRLLRYSLK